MPRGDRLLGAAFGALGLLWVVKSLDLDYMGDFAPGAGFLPFWLGTALAVLSVIFLVKPRKAVPDDSKAEPPDAAAAPPGAWRKTLSILIGLSVCVGTIGWLGFVVPVSALLLFLVKFVERRSWRAAIAVSAGTTAGLFVVFSTWLGVPFPKGPWGF